MPDAKSALSEQELGEKMWDAFLQAVARGESTAAALVYMRVVGQILAAPPPSIVKVTTS